MVATEARRAGVGGIGEDQKTSKRLVGLVRFLKFQLVDRTMCYPKHTTTTENQDDENDECIRCVVQKIRQDRRNKKKKDYGVVELSHENTKTRPAATIDRFHFRSQ